MKDITQLQQVVDVMKRNGGFATLGYLYHNVDVSKWGTKTPFKSINRIVQNSRYFFKIRPGLWALNELRTEVLRTFEIEERGSKGIDFNHYYYQGLLVEVGNLKGYQTYVPNQDKNKPFLGKPLGQVSSMTSILDFSYETFVKRARSVDVIWFNERRMPDSFFEVEHSTDIYNSLLKFSELRDFYSSFCIVADAVRHREFESKLILSSFKEIKNRVTFMSYESLSQIHSNTYKLAKAEENFAFLRK